MNLIHVTLKISSSQVYSIRYKSMGVGVSSLNIVWNWWGKLSFWLFIWVWKVFCFCAVYKTSLFQANIKVKRSRPENFFNSFIILKSTNFQVLYLAMQFKPNSCFRDKYSWYVIDYGFSLFSEGIKASRIWLSLVIFVKSDLNYFAARLSETWWLHTFS